MGQKRARKFFSVIWFISAAVNCIVDNLEECLSTSGRKAYEKSFGAQIYVKRGKIGLKPMFFVIFLSLVH